MSYKRVGTLLSLEKFGHLYRDGENNSGGPGFKIIAYVMGLHPLSVELSFSSFCQIKAPMAFCFQRSLPPQCSFFFSQFSPSQTKRERQHG